MFELKAIRLEIVEKNDKTIAYYLDIFRLVKIEGKFWWKWIDDTSTKKSVYNKDLSLKILEEFIQKGYCNISSINNQEIIRSSEYSDPEYAPFLQEHLKCLS